MLLLVINTDAEKLEILYKTYAKIMFSSAISVLHDKFLAEDAVHEAFISLSKNLDKINDISSPETKAYVCRSARTRAINILNSRNTEISSELSSDIPSDFDVFAEVCALADEELLSEAINALPPLYRDAVILRFLDGMKPKEIANALGENIETIKKRLTRASKMLKETLAKGGYDK